MHNLIPNSPDLALLDFIFPAFQYKRVSKSWKLAIETLQNHTLEQLKKWSTSIPQALPLKHFRVQEIDWIGSNVIGLRQLEVRKLMNRIQYNSSPAPMTYSLRGSKADLLNEKLVGNQWSFMGAWKNSCFYANTKTKQHEAALLVFSSQGIRELSLPMPSEDQEVREHGNQIVCCLPLSETLVWVVTNGAGIGLWDLKSEKAVLQTFLQHPFNEFSEFDNQVYDAWFESTQLYCSSLDKTKAPSRDRSEKLVVYKLRDGGLTKVTERPIIPFQRQGLCHPAERDMGNRSNFKVKFHSSGVFLVIDGATQNVLYRRKAPEKFESSTLTFWQTRETVLIYHGNQLSAWNLSYNIWVNIKAIQDLTKARLSADGKTLCLLKGRDRRAQSVDIMQL